MTGPGAGQNKAGRGILFAALIALAVVFSNEIVVAQQYSLGADLDPEEYANVPRTAPLARGNYLDVPPSISLKLFVPPVGDQGEQGSCVGWATAYTARTLMRAKELEVTSSQRLRDLVLSPSYVFNQVERSDCQGSFIHHALELMREQGVALMSDFPYDENACWAYPSASVRADARDFRIKGYTRLWGETARNKHVATRRALANGNPVVIGMEVTQTFMDHQSSSTWRPTSAEIEGLQDVERARETGTLLGGHAITVVGYEDTRNGGAFEIVNSWGRDWGNDGYTWMSYDMYNAFVSEGYEVLPLDPPPPPRVVDMGGTVRILHISGDEIGARVDGNGYRLTRPLPSGTRFRVEASSAENGYLYVIGGDATGDYVAIFPRDHHIAPYAQQDATLLLPGPTEQHFTRLNDTEGTDFYILLFAQDKLNPDVIAKRMARGSGGVRARLQQVLGDRLVPEAEMDLAPTKIGFEAASGPADVAALILTIDHVAPQPGSRDTEGPLIVLTNPTPEAFDVDTAPVRVLSRIFWMEGIAQDESDIASLRVDGALSSQYSSRGPFRAEIELPAGPGPHPVTIVTRDVAGNISRRMFQFSVSTF